MGNKGDDAAKKIDEAAINIKVEDMIAEVHSNPTLESGQPGGRLRDYLRDHILPPPDETSGRPLRKPNTKEGD